MSCSRPSGLPAFISFALFLSALCAFSFGAHARSERTCGPLGLRELPLPRPPPFPHACHHRPSYFLPTSPPYSRAHALTRALPRLASPRPPTPALPLRLWPVRVCQRKSACACPTRLRLPHGTPALVSRLSMLACLVLVLYLLFGILCGCVGKAPGGGGRAKPEQQGGRVGGASVPQVLVLYHCMAKTTGGVLGSMAPFPRAGAREGGAWNPRALRTRALSDRRGAVPGLLPGVKGM